MKFSYYILISSLIITVCSFTDDNYEKKKISNPLYSLSIPIDWECAHPGNIKDCSTPLERNDPWYHLYYLQWRSPAKDSFFSVSVETYQRLDSATVTIEEVEAIILKNKQAAENTSTSKKFEKQELVSDKANQKRFIIQTESVAINVTTGKHTERSNWIYLLHKSPNKVHCVTIFVEESQYVFPKTQELVNDILDSFIVYE